MITCSKIEKEKIVIHTERLFIRPLKGEDVTEAYVFGLNDPEVNRFMWVRHQKQTLRTVRDFADSKYHSSDSALLGLFLEGNDELVGTVGLSGISFYHYCLGVGICLFLKKYWGQGLGTEALRGVKDYIFQEMGFHYIEAGVFADNIVSQKLFVNSGFECFWKVENKYRYNDKFVDVLWYRAINPDFKLPERGSIL